MEKAAQALLAWQLCVLEKHLNRHQDINWEACQSDQIRQGDGRDMVEREEEASPLVNGSSF